MAQADTVAQLDAMNAHNVMSTPARGPDLAGAAQLGAADCVPFRSRQVIEELVQARHFDYHDELTGLPNRSLLLDRLHQAIIQAARQNKQVGLLLLDLDGFKGINDRLGRRLRSHLSSTQHSTSRKIKYPNRVLIHFLRESILA